MAKTQKIIGTLYLVKNDYAKARSYLIKAKKIFEANKFKKHVSEINKKLRMIKNMKEKAEMEKFEEGIGFSD